MKERDALGRRRQPEQNRGLRSLFPKLPQDTQSRLIRVAMSSQAWEQLERLVAEASAPTKPRAYGDALEQLLNTYSASQQDPLELTIPVFIADIPPQEAPPFNDWQAWQIRKELSLLSTSSPH